MKEFDDVMDNFLKSEIVNHIVFILDHSGSMMGSRAISALRNYNNQINQLKEESRIKNQKTFVSMVKFNTRHTVEYWEKNVGDLEEIDTYNCRGSTALNDTIASIINKTDDIKELNDKNKNHSVLFIIMTDGEENASIEFKGTLGRDRLKSLIEEREKRGNWTFTFTGCNLDVQKEMVKGLSFALGNTMSFSSNTEGFKRAGAETMSGISNYYSCRSRGLTNTRNFYNTTDNTIKE